MQLSILSDSIARLSDLSTSLAKASIITREDTEVVKTLLLAIQREVGTSFPALKAVRQELFSNPVGEHNLSSDLPVHI